MTTYGIIIFVILMCFTFFMGFNDGSSAVATTVATRAIKPRTAVIVAAITKFVTPILFFYITSMSVAGNIATNMVYAEYFEGLGAEKAFAFLLSAMLGAVVWSAIAYVLKLPLSPSHTLLGGILGAAICIFGFSAVKWTEYVIVKVILMIVLAPVIGLALGFILMRIIKVIGRHTSREFSKVMVIIQRVNLVVLAGAFASNNAEKSLGVVFMIGVLGLSSYSGQSSTPVWIVIVIAAALTLGLLCGGYRVINTIGRKIFKLESAHSVASQLTTSFVMITSTALGIPLSNSQVMSASVIGVGAADRIKSVHWQTAIRIVTSWAFTLPAAAGISALMYLLIGKAIFGF